MPDWNPFRKKEDTPPTQADQSKAEIDALVERLGASFEEKIKPLREEFTTLKTDWESIKAAATKEATPPPDPDNPPPAPTENEKRLLALTVVTNARMTESEIIGEVSGKWAKFVPKIKEYFQNTPIERKAKPDYADYCRNIVKMVIGEAAMTNGLSYDGTGNRFFLEDSSVKAGENADIFTSDLTWTDPHTKKTFTATDQLAKMGIDPKAFAESVKRGVV